jgi:hypothetical protein
MADEVGRAEVQEWMPAILMTDEIGQAKEL